MRAGKVCEFLSVCVWGETSVQGSGNAVRFISFGSDSFPQFCNVSH